MRSLLQSLSDYDMALLRAIAEERGVALSSNRHGEVVEQLARELCRPDSVAQALARLSPEEREAVDSLLRQGGRMKAHLFARRYGQVRPFGPGRLEWEKPWLNPANVAERLWYLGLIFKAFDEVDNRAGEFVYIPDDVLPLLPQPPQSPSSFPVEETPCPPLIEEADDSLVEDAFLLLCHFQNEDVKPLRDGSLPRLTRDSLEQSLMARGGLGKERDRAARLDFVYHLCRHAGLLELREGFLRPNPAVARAWLRSSPERQLLSLQEAWRKDVEWNDLWKVPGLVCEDTGWRNDPLLARQKLLNHLARCPTGRWLSLSSLVGAIKEQDPDFMRPDGDYNSWYIRDATTGRYLMGFENWEHVEGAFIRYLIAFPLRWLGITSVGYVSPEEPPHAFLITEHGAIFLGLAPLPEETPPSPIVVRPDMAIIAPPDASLYDRFQLERFALLESQEDGYRYRITMETLARALRKGIRVDMILAFLRRASSGRLPGNVTQALRQWAERHSQVSLRRGVVLETGDRVAMEELRASPRVRALLGEPLSEKAAWVDERNIPRLMEELRRLGFVPRWEG